MSGHALGRRANEHSRDLLAIGRNSCAPRNMNQRTDSERQRGGADPLGMVPRGSGVEALERLTGGDLSTRKSERRKKAPEPTNSIMSPAFERCHFSALSIAEMIDKSGGLLYRNQISVNWHQAPQGLIGNPVRIGNGPAAVNGDEIR
jgi:hypothetical protein